MDSGKDSRSRVGKSIALGVAWTLAVRTVIRLVSIVSTLLLARLLTPADFGIYALAMSVYGFIELLRAFGFGTALIQNQASTDAHYDTAWTMHLMFSLVAALGLYLSAPIAADFLNEHSLVSVIQFLCILFLVDGVKNIGIINFQKDMKFNREFQLQVAVKVAGFLVTIPLAFWMRNYWAMLWGLLASSIVLVMLSYMMQSYRPRFSLVHWRELISFTVWLQINNILSYFNRNIENFMVSRYAGVADVGSLTLAKESGNLPRELTQPINRVAFAGYSKVNHDREKLLGVFQDVMGFMMLGCFPLAVGIFSVAHLMVPTLLGGQWLHLIPLVRGLALITLFMVWVGSTNNVLIALGKQRLATIIIGVRLAIFVVLLKYLLTAFGLMGVVYASFLAIFTSMLLSHSFMRALLGMQILRVVYMIYKPAIASIVMHVVISYLFPAQWSGSPLLYQFIQLLSAAGLGALVYSLILIILWLLESRPEGPEMKVLRFVESRAGLVGFLLPK